LISFIKPVKNPHTQHFLASQHSVGFLTTVRFFLGRPRGFLGLVVFFSGIIYEIYLAVYDEAPVAPGSVVLLSVILLFVLSLVPVCSLGSTIIFVSS
jgi:hypothetical protein